MAVHPTSIWGFFFFLFCCHLLCFSSTVISPPPNPAPPFKKSKAPKGEQVNVLAVWDTLVTFQSGICFYRSWFKECGGGREGNGGMKGGIERQTRKRRSEEKKEKEERAHGMAQLPRDCGLCVRHSRGCGPAVAAKSVNGSAWSCRPQVARSGSDGAMGQTAAVPQTK